MGGKLMQGVDRDRNQHSDPSGAPVDPRGPMSTQNFIRNSFLIVLEGIGDAKCSKICKNTFPSALQPYTLTIRM